MVVILIKPILKNLVGQFLNCTTVRNIIVLGDSHALVFMSRRFRRYFPLTKFDVCSVGGATASGLDNPNSLTAAYEMFSNKLSSVPKNSIVIVMLGEVDTGFVIWWRSQKSGEGIELMLGRAVKNYTKFISELDSSYRPLVIRTPMPTITDDNEWGEVANLRSEISATQRERTDLTLRFNSEIREYCGRYSIPYVDLDKASLGDDGLVADHLIGGNRNDHHYDVGQYLKLMAPRLRIALKRVL